MRKIGTTPDLRRSTLKRLIAAKDTVRIIESHSPLSALIGERVNVHVENEFCLPTNTVTRVKVQDKDVKTIFTRSIPINENETILYWKLYRNFWIGNTIMNCIGDFFVRKLMNQVVQEDVNILQGIDVKNKDGPVKTKYDKTILMYRKFIKDFME